MAESKRVWVVLVMLLAACAPIDDHTVNVAPSAEGQMETILEAVGRLNGTIETKDEPMFTVRAVDSEERRRGAILIRTDPKQRDAVVWTRYLILGVVDSGLGTTIVLRPDTDVGAIAGAISKVTGAATISSVPNTPSVPEQHEL